jgi:hypothetical protein
MIPQAERERLSLVARYDRRGGVEVAGRPDDLRRLSDLLLSEDGKAAFDLTVPRAEDAAPYDGFLSSMSVETADQKARITRRGDSVRVVGSRVALTSLARSIEFIASNGDTKSAHIHVEFYEGHRFLEPDSEPLTVALRGADDA